MIPGITCHAMTWVNGEMRSVVELQGRKKRYVALRSDPLVRGGAGGQNVGLLYSDKRKWYVGMK